ncbi:TPA: hypothetical protein ACPDKP_000777 [Pasteurella multocida]
MGKQENLHRFIYNLSIPTDNSTPNSQPVQKDIIEDLMPELLVEADVLEYPDIIKDLEEYIDGLQGLLNLTKIKIVGEIANKFCISARQDESINSIFCKIVQFRSINPESREINTQLYNRHKELSTIYERFKDAYSSCKYTQLEHVTPKLDYDAVKVKEILLEHFRNIEGEM